MALIEVHHVNKVTATVQFEEPIADSVNRYSAFIHASADDVINRALEYVFAKDKDFQKHLLSTANVVVPASLQVRESRGSNKPVQQRKAPVSVVGK